MALLKAVKPKVKRERVAEAEKRLKRVYADVAYDTVKDYKETVKTWKDKPTFRVKTTRDGTEISTTQDKFIWTDEGTKPHDIVAGPGKVLVFGASTPKTRPGNIGSGPGSRGPRDRRAKRVRHPGTEARKFSKIIADRRNKILLRKIDEVLEGLT